jgi:hypothetical protein
MLRDSHRLSGGRPDYYALLTGYHGPPAGMQMTEHELQCRLQSPAGDAAARQGQLRRVPAGVGQSSLERNAQDVTTFSPGPPATLTTASSNSAGGAPICITTIRSSRKGRLWTRETLTPIAAA